MTWVAPGCYQPGVAADYLRYLLAKRSVEDRALNRHVVDTLRAQLSPGTPTTATRVVEVGAGPGTMIARAFDWGLLRYADYTAIDEDARAAREAARHVSEWAAGAGMTTREQGDETVFEGDDRRLVFRYREGDLTAADKTPEPADLLIASAVLDLVDLGDTLPRLWAHLSPGGLFWFPVNFDGETIFMPACDPPFEAQLLELYHLSMDERVVAGRKTGGSRTGRLLLGAIPDAGGEILAAGSSDWVVHPIRGAYPGDEATFLRHILATIENELRGHPELSEDRFRAWFEARRRQVDGGELSLVSHQLDFVGRAPGSEAP